MELRSPADIKASSEIINRALKITGIIAALCIGGGNLALYWNSTSATNINFFGINVTTGNVAVAFTALSFGGIVIVVRQVLKIIVKLSQIPPQGHIENIQWISQKFTKEETEIKELKVRIEHLETLLSNTEV